MKGLLLLFIIGFGTIYAQNDSINKLDEIVLRGNFSPLVNSGYEIQVITDSLLRTNYESLGNLLQKQANFYFKQNGNGMVSSISLRGTTASQTGVYWNGIGINSALNGQTDFNTIQATSFDELEVRKGGGSVLLGNGSIGGAINLKDNINFNKKSSAEVMMGAGSFETYFTQLTGVFSSNSFYAKVSGGGMSSANDFEYGETGLKNENGAFKNFNLNATFGYKINDANFLSFNTTVFDNERELSGTLTTESNAKLENKDHRYLLNWTYLGDRFTSSLKTAYLSEDFTYFSNQDDLSNESFGKTGRFIGKYDLSYFLNNNLFFKGGLELEKADGEGTSISQVSQTDFTAYLLMNHQLFEKLIYNISARAGSSTAYSIPFIYSLDAKYLLSENTSLRAAYSTNYRLPTFNDLYWEPGGNPDLKPEYSNSGELGLEYATESLRLSGGAFFINSKDLIQWRPITQDFWRPENVSKASNYGLEFTADFSQNFGGHFLSLRLNYDYVMATNEEINKQLIYVPKHRAGAILDYSWKKWGLNYNLQYVGEVYTTTSNTQSLDDYLLSDIVFYRSLFKDHIGLSFKINNLFDVDYQSVAYRPMPNRNYVFQVNFKI